MRLRRFIPLLVVLGSLAGSPSALAAEPDSCEKGADIAPADCKFFFLRKPRGTENTDPRISQRMQDAGANPSFSRSIALIISISEYPNFANEKNRKLAAARTDLENLKKFLVGQSFDEIIVIENEYATRANIDHILGAYLNAQLDLHLRAARVLIAYTGHGAEGDPQNKLPGSLVLQAARDSQDTDNLYDLNDLRSKLEKLANKSFQLVALIGACYSGGLFSHAAIYDGGNDMFPGGRGAHAISATQADKLSYGLSDTSGSIFFDAFVKAATDPWTDINYAQLSVLPDGSRKLLGGGIIRLGMIIGAVTSRLDQLGKIPGADERFPQPIYGSIKTDAASEGALFFLGPKASEVAANLGPDIKISSTEALQTTGSAVVGHPELKVFSAPDTYKVYGVDVSHWEEKIDWKKVAANKRIRFAYMKATERSKDETFDYNWAQAKSAGLRRGAFHTFSFCRPAKVQFETIKKYVPRTEDALPFALDVLWYGKPAMNYEKQCTDVAAIRANLAELMKLCQEYFGKPVVLYTPAEFWASFSSVVTPETIVWLQDWKSPLSSETGPTMSGVAPWTIWQFSRSARIPGIGSGGADMNAFFGSPSEFEEFAKGNSVALKAALSGSGRAVK